MVQDKELSVSNEKRNRQRLLWFGKLLVTALIFSYIFKTFQSEQKGISDVGAVIKRIWAEDHFPVMALMLVLVPLNWALESKKWQLLAQKVEQLTFRDAFRGTLTGLAVGVAAPAQLGDTIGRVAALRSDRKLEAIGAAVVSNGIQFYISIVAGACGWLYLNDQLYLGETAKNILAAVLIMVIMLGVAAVIFRKTITRFHPQRPFLIKIVSYFRIIGEYSATELLTATFFGALRYLVFLSQFMLALSLFDFSLPIAVLSSCVALIFLAKTIIPAVNILGDLGLREFTALFVFKQYNLPAEEIITATFTVWIINVLGPILIGIFLIWKYKWKTFKNG